MSYRSDELEYMSLDDFEEASADRPGSERWELIGGRVVKMTVGAPWDHHLIIQNLVVGLRQRLGARGGDRLVYSDKAAIDVFDRGGDAWASRRTTAGSLATLDLPCLGVSIPPAEIDVRVLTP